MPLKQLRNKNKRQAATLLKGNSLGFKFLKMLLNRRTLLEGPNSHIVQELH